MYTTLVTSTRRIHRQSDDNISSYLAPPREQSTEFSQNDDDSSSLDELDDAKFINYNPLVPELVQAPQTSHSHSRKFNG
jgi:hypothetical protein